MNDIQGRPLIPFRIQDTLRHKSVWAVYKIPRDGYIGECQSELSDLATAKTRADVLNARRESGGDHFYKVFRIATASEADSGGREHAWR